MGKLSRPDRMATEYLLLVAPDVAQLNQVAEAWRDRGAKDQHSNHQFLDLFAIYLVTHFRAEEMRLEQQKAPGLVWHRNEHRRLVRRIWDLMGDVRFGLDVTEGIHQFLEAWFLHQQSVGVRMAGPSGLAH
jgi:hemerythrin